MYVCRSRMIHTFFKSSSPTVAGDSNCPFTEALCAYLRAPSGFCKQVWSTNLKIFAMQKFKTFQKGWIYQCLTKNTNVKDFTFLWCVVFITLSKIMRHDLSSVCTVSQEQCLYCLSLRKLVILWKYFFILRVVLFSICIWKLFLALVVLPTNKSVILQFADEFYFEISQYCLYSKHLSEDFCSIAEKSVGGTHRWSLLYSFVWSS